MIAIPIEISIRHVHLAAEHWKQLFGDQALQTDHPISQRPQFLATQRVAVIGPKGRLDRVGIVGPLRSYAQVELAMTDAVHLGIVAPLRESGHLDQAATVTIEGPHGRVEVPAAIIQRRHIHANPDDAANAGLTDQQVVSVRIEGQRGGHLEQVVVRVDPSFTWRLHLDSDEGNALGVHNGDTAYVT